jgi:hypothetical protein
VCWRCCAHTRLHSWTRHRYVENCTFTPTVTVTGFREDLNTTFDQQGSKGFITSGQHSINLTGQLQYAHVLTAIAQACGAATYQIELAATVCCCAALLLLLLQLVSGELIRIAILWHEQWHEALEEASRCVCGGGGVGVVDFVGEGGGRGHQIHLNAVRLYASQLLHVCHFAKCVPHHACIVAAWW